MCKYCILTGQPITAANDSKAHVIPSALGGRLKPLGILSDQANTELNDKFDLPLIQAFQSLMNLLNGSRDRGKNQPTRMIDEAGKSYLFKFGEPLSLTAPEFTEVVQNDETHIVIKARNLKEARTLFGRVKTKYPALSVDECMKHAVLGHQWPDGMLHHQIQIGASVLFPFAFVAASIFAKLHNQASHPSLINYVKSFDPDVPHLPPDTFYFMPNKRWISAAADVAHIVALATRAATHEMFVYIELFNIACVGVLLPYDGSVDVQETHAIDVLTGQEVTVNLDRPALDAISWSSTHQSNDSALLSITKSKLQNLIAIAREREWSNELDKIIKKGLGPSDGRPLMPEDYAKVIGEVVEFVKIQWTHPTFSSADKQSMLPTFNELCSALENKLPSFLRSKFRTLIHPHTQALIMAAAK